MLRLIPFVISISFIFFNLNAQSSLDSLIYHYSNSYKSGTEFLIVKGRLTDNYSNNLNEIFNSWNQEYIKYEDELDSADFKKHLQFYGPINSYKHLNKFLPKVMTISDEGFTFGPYEFTDSLDAISLISSESDRWFQIANSLTGLNALWTTFQDLSQYFIMQNWAITHHGFLLNDEFNEKQHFDVWKLRKEKLIEKESRYYKFYYDSSVFSISQNIETLFVSEDEKFERIIQFFGLKYFDKKIECFLYKDFEQKYYLSATPGFGNPFPLALQNHSIGFAPVEHETIHILFENQFGLTSTFISEGIVGYYYSTLDTLEWKKNKMIVSSKIKFDIQPYLNYSKGFDFSSLDYAASVFFAKYLIDSYGLEKYKLFYTYGGGENAFKMVYEKEINQISEEWENYFNNNRISLGTEKKIIFRVITNNLPLNSRIFITGDHESFANWDPAKIELSKQSEGYWEKEFTFQENTIISYKITRGSWEDEALDEKGNVPPNSVYEVKEDDIVILHVDLWKDQILK